MMKEAALPGGPAAGDSPTRVAHLRLQEVIDRWLEGRRQIRVLEAGCGAITHVRLPDDVVLTGLDISVSQLERNVTAQRKILGDVQSHDFGGEQFDLVISYNVLEHVPHPDRAVENLLRACADDGLLVIAVPNLWSIKGIVTRLTPFAVHRWFYWLMGDRRAGTAEFDQFPTFLRLSVAPHRLVSTATQAGAEVRFFHLYEGPVQEDLRSRMAVVNATFAAVGTLSKIVTFGRHNLNHTDALLVFSRAHSRT